LNYHALVFTDTALLLHVQVIVYISSGDKTGYRLLVYFLLQCPPLGSLLTLSDRLCTYTTGRWIYTGHLWGKV